MIPDHTRNVKRFDSDTAGTIDNRGSCLLLCVLTDTGDAIMQLGYLVLEFVVVVTAFDLAAQTALEPLEFPLAPLQRFRVLEILSVTGNGKVFDANIHAHHGLVLIIGNVFVNESVNKD